MGGVRVRLSCSAAADTRALCLGLGSPPNERVRVAWPLSAVHAPRAEVKGRGERAQGEPWGMCGTETAGGGAGGLGRVAGDVRGGRGRGGCGEADSTAQRSKRLILARMKRGRCGVVMETSE